MGQHISNNGDLRNVNLSCSQGRALVAVHRSEGGAQLTGRVGTGARKKSGQGSRINMSHAQNDARYVAAGRMPALVANPDAEEELRRMNRDKRGRPYKYAD